VEGLEVGGGELARDPPDVEVHVSRGRGQVDLDADDVEPDEEAADLDAREVREGAVAEHPRDAGLEVGEVFEVYVAGAGQIDDEATVGGEREEGDGGGEDARGQAVEREDLREGRVLVRRRRRRRRVGKEGGAAGSPADAAAGAAPAARRKRRARGSIGGAEEREEWAAAATPMRSKWPWALGFVNYLGVFVSAYKKTRFRIGGGQWRQSAGGWVSHGKLVLM
jgi:hypothetical protein